MIKFRKDLVPCTPPENKAIQYEMKTGVRTVTNLLRLTPLKVVLPNEHFEVGSVVYVPGDYAKADQRMYAHQVGDQDVSFILVDLGHIYAAEDGVEPALSDEEADAYLKAVEVTYSPTDAFTVRPVLRTGSDKGADRSSKP